MGKPIDPATQQARMAVDAAMKKLGKGWEILSPAMREAFVAREIISLIHTQMPSLLEKNPELKHYADTARVAFEIVEGG